MTADRLDLEALAARHPEGVHACPNCEEYQCDGSYFTRGDFSCEVAALVAEVERLREAIRVVVVDPPYHDCRGPMCKLCRLADALTPEEST